MKKKAVYIAVGMLIIYLLYHNIRSSIFIHNQDRVNIVFYGKNPAYYSLGNEDVNYMVLFSSEIEFLIPGGYGYYKIGALGKLVSLEKKPELFKRAFSVNTSSFTDIYFYPKDPIVYYDTSDYTYRPPSVSEIFLSRSNASLLDRVFIYFSFLDKGKSQFKPISDLPVKKERNRTIFDRDEFSKQYQGYFYKKTYRKEKNTVQLLYTKSFKTAEILSQVLEGEGIRVVDISLQEKASKSCTVFQNAPSLSQTAKNISLFFNCKIGRKQTEVSDILFPLGTLEDEWLVE